MKKYKIILAMVFMFFILCLPGYCESEPESQPEDNREKIYEDIQKEGVLWVVIQENEVKSYSSSEKLIGEGMQETNEAWKNEFQEFNDISNGEKGVARWTDVSKTIRDKNWIPQKVEDALNRMFGKGNWAINFERDYGFATTETIDTKKENFLIAVSVNGKTGKEEYKDNVIHVYQDGNVHYKDGETHLSATLSPNKNNMEGKEKLYTLGESIRIEGNHCNHLTKYFEECYEHKITKTIRESYKKWVPSKKAAKDIGAKGIKDVTIDVESEQLGEYETRYEDVSRIFEEAGCGKQRNIYYRGKFYDIDIEFKGFKVGKEKKSSLHIPGASTSNLSSKPWGTGALQITEIDNAYYDSKEGTFYGLINIKSNCCRNGGCSKVFKLYFGDPTPETLKNLTVKVTPNTSGEVKVTGIMDIDGDGKVEKDPQTVTVTSEETLRVVVGNGYRIESTANNGYVYKWIVTPDGNVISSDNPYDYVMPPVDSKIIVHFTPIFAPIPPRDEPDRSGDVKFVAETSTPEDGIIPGTVPEDLYDIAAGAEVTFGVTANTGYEFWYWYFTDTNGEIITPDNEYTDYGSGKFVMPDYDIIAHAVFRIADTRALEVRIEGNGKVENDGNNIPSGTVIAVPKGDTIELVATPEDGWKFLHWKDEDGNILSEEEVFKYRVDEDKVIIAVFVQKNKYKLYVSSMNGGEAWTDGNENHPKESIIEKTDDLGKTVYKIVDVYEGEKFDIFYSVTEDGYSFDKWEYKPYIKADSEYNNKKSGFIEITMPNSDLTVTAVFKNNDIISEPELRVTSNNEEWGTAHTIIGGKPTKMDKTYNATIGENYDLYYEAKTGYYFVNWVYSTTKSPFVGENRIEMPDKNLEVMALFSPIPEPKIPPEDGAEKHSVDFTAEPPEGGSIPEDLVGDKEIYAGSKVTIGVTPNEGWEFDYWYFTDKDGNIIDVEVHFDSDGSGYFIMPDEDVIAIAVFRKAGRYILYVTYTAGGNAWVMDGNTKTTRIDEAIAEKIYDIDYKVEDGYKFVGWEFRWDKYGVNPPEGVQPYIYQDENRAVMPYSDMTVTAKFEKTNDTGDYKLRVISNNYIWGNAWLIVDGKEYCWRDIVNGEIQQNANGEAGIMLEADKDYEVYYKAEDGYIFTNWLPDEFFIHREFSDKEGYGIINIPKEYLKDIDLTAYFKPSPGEETFDLTVKAEPEDAGKVVGDEKDIKVGDSFYVNVEKVNSGYKFKYWYYEIDGRKVKVTTEKSYEGKMPNRDLELIAHFGNAGEGENGGKEPKEAEDYYIIVKIEGEGQVIDSESVIVTKRQMDNGESIKLVAKPASGYYFAGWLVEGRIVDTEPNTMFTIDGESIIVTACFVEKAQNLGDGLKIISVRDLRWKDFFVNSSSLTGNVFKVPQGNTTMLQAVNNYPEVLKMGYAVEFELATSQLKPEKTVLVIKPEIISNDEKVEWSKIKEINNKSISSDFEEIVIYGDGSTSKSTSMYMAKVKTDNSYFNNGININKMLWNWVYYLPGEIYFNNSRDEVTIRFNIELHETSDGRTYNSKTLKQNYVLFEQKYGGVRWNGDVYKYSMKQSLFDDIYDNATN